MTGLWNINDRAPQVFFVARQHLILLFSRVEILDGLRYDVANLDVPLENSTEESIWQFGVEIQKIRVDVEPLIRKLYNAFLIDENVKGHRLFHTGNIFNDINLLILVSDLR